MSTINPKSPLAVGILVHIEPRGAKRDADWSGRVWRDGEQIGECIDRTPSGCLIGVVQLLGTLLLDDATDVAASAFQAQLLAELQRTQAN